MHIEKIRVRIMQEAYDLADRNDAEGYNSVKVMCSDVLALLSRQWAGLTEEEIGELYRAGWTNNMDFARAIEAKLKEKNT